MKNSKEYSQKVKKLHRSLRRKYAKPAKILYEEPAEALVYGVISENMSEKQAQSAMKRFSEHFVDLNDLRVSLGDEIAEQLGADMSTGRETASRLKTKRLSLLITILTWKKCCLKPTIYLTTEKGTCFRFILGFGAKRRIRSKK